MSDDILRSPSSERSVIGCISLDAVRAMSVCGEYGVSRHWFSDATLAGVWSVVSAMPSDRIDGLTMTEECRKAGVAFGMKDADECSDSAGRTVHHLRQHVESMKDAYTRRLLVKLATEAKNMAVDGSVKSTASLSKLLSVMMKMQGALSGVIYREPREVYDEILSQLSKIRSGNGVYGVPSCIPSVNRMLGGYKGIAVIAARPGAGKSTFVANELAGACIRGMKCSLASHEMTEEQFRLRMLCEQASVCSFEAQTGDITDDDFMALVERAKEHSEWPLRISDCSMTIEQICSWMSAEVQIHGAQLLAIDYLQIITSSAKFRESRAQEVAGWMNLLRETQKRIGVPLLLVAQMSRSYEQENRKPRLSDLRESGAIEQDATQVVFIHRTEKDETSAIVAKNRFGPTGDIPINFDKRISRFSEIRQQSTVSEVGVGVPSWADVP